jgi:DNA repair exonuclease SbcCD nuclease subunit
MVKILHAADLHLSEAEREYGLAVWAELVATARREKVAYLAFCGDLFNTFADAESLRADVRRILGSPPFELLYLPGNHEELQRGAKEMGRLDFGALTLAGEKPWTLLGRDRGGTAVEFLAIPHQDDYAGYGNWKVPPKGSAWRMVMAHGVVAGMAYRGPDEESGGTAIDPDLFQRFQADYAALGHIHGRRTQRLGGAFLAYPGSSRVWRRGESGPRGAYLVEAVSGGVAGAVGVAGTGPTREPVFMPLAAAGEYRRYALPLSLEGEIPDLEPIAREWRAPDWIELEFTGLVEDENAVARLEAGIRARWQGKVRRLEVVRDGVSALPGIASHPIAQRFLEKWLERMPDPGDAEYPVWLRSRELALGALKANLERRA